MKSKRTIMALSILSILVLAATGAFAQPPTLTVGSGSGAAVDTIQIPITVSDPVGIAGAAFTLQYDTSALALTVDSTFFDTFASQFAAASTPEPYSTTVDVKGITYDQPLITNEATMGTRIAAARCTAADDSNDTLFTLCVSLKTGAQEGTYPITAVPTSLNYTPAGYGFGPDGIPDTADDAPETIDLLIGADLSQPYTSTAAYPVILDDADYAGYVTAGSVTLGEPGPGKAPVAVAGPDFTTVADVEVTLDGSHSKPETATFAWSRTAGTTVTLNNATTVNASFTPTTAGIYTFKLIVTANGIDSVPDEITVTVVAASSEEAAILAVYQDLNDAVGAYIADRTSANMDLIMAFFSDSFLDYGEDKAEIRVFFEEDLGSAISFKIYVNNIEVTSSTQATCMQTEILQMYNEWGQAFIEFDTWTMDLRKEDGTWKAYGNQEAHDVWVDTVSRSDGTFALNVGFDGEPGEVTSITVSGPGIDGSISLYDDGLHRDCEANDGEWANIIPLDLAPSVGDTYTFNIDGNEVSAGVTGTMTAFATNGTVSEEMPPSFYWDAAEGVMFYSVQLYDPETGLIEWHEWGIQGTFVEYMGPPLYQGKTYQWRVFAYDMNENFSVSEFFTYIPTIGPEGGDKTISGNVSLSDETPVAGIWVNAWSDSQMTGNGAQSDATGNYTITHLVAASDYRVDVWHEDYAFQFYMYEGYQPGDAPPTDSDYSSYSPVGTSDWGQATQVDVFVNDASGVDFVLSAGVTISGTVTDETTTGVGGVWVNAWSESTWACGGTETNPDGTYTITGLQPGTDYRVEIWDDRYAHQFYMYAGYQSGDPAPANNDYCALNAIGTNIWEEATLVTTYEDNPAVCVNFVVAEGVSISGLVLADGAPLANVWVNAWSDSQMTGNGAETDQNGEYTIHGLVPASDYRVDMWSPDYTYQIYNNKTDWMNADLVDISTDDAVNINFNVSSGNSISGRVVDDYGQGVANVWVNAHSESLMSGRGEPTDANGDYTIPNLIPVSDYRVDIWVEDFIGQFYDGQTDWMLADLVDVTTTSATGIDFVLSAGVCISGTITLPGSESDYSNMWVNAWSESTWIGSGAPVNNDGTYEICGLAAATDYKVDVWSDNYAHKHYSVTNPQGVSDWMQASLVSTAQGSVSGIDITLSAGNSISGTVTGLASGDWIWVNAWSETAMCGNGTDITGTGDAVAYTIKGLEPAADYKVEIYSDNYQNQFYNGKTDWMLADLVDVTTDSMTGINFTLSTGASISGTVEDSEGNGVAWVWVDAWSETGSWGGASTDSEGNFTINGLTDNTEYNVNIWHPDYANQTLTVTTGTDEAGNVGFALNEGISISGTVTDGSNPIAGAWVNAWSESNMCGRGEPTDANGEYTIKGLAPANDYRVDVWMEGYANQFYNNKAFWHDADLVDTTEGSCTGIDFTLSTGGKISGTITIPADGSKHDIWVNAWSETKGGMGAPVESWNELVGTYEITGLLPANDYKVDIWSPNYQHVHYKEGVPSGVSDWMQASLVDITGTDAENINFVLDAGKKISGTVTAPDSLAYLWVNAWSESAGSWGGAPVDAGTGVYTITGLAAAPDFKVDIWSDTYGYQIYNGKSNWEDADLVSTQVGDAAGIDFNLSEGKSISGTITLPEGGNYWNVWVNAWSESKRMGRGEPTDSNGNYIIKGLEPASDYKVDVWADEYGHAFYKEDATNNATTDWMQATLLDITTDSAEGISITLTEGGSISGHVEDGDGHPIAWAWVNAWCPAGGNGADTDANGDYTIKGLPSSDNYKVDVWAEGYVHEFYDNKTDWMDADVVDISSGDAVDINFVLGSGNTISGTVTNGTDPIPYVWVNAWSESSCCWGGASTDSNGDYTIRGLAAASDYVVDVWSETYAHQFYNQKTDWMDADRVDISGVSKEDIDFVLSTGNYISGTITLPGGSTDYHMVWVNAWSDDVLSGNGCPVKHNGTYKIAGLIPGTGYKVDVWSEEYVHAFYKDGATNNTTTDWADATKIDISSDSQTDIDMTLGSGLSISGTVTLGDTGIGRVWLDAWSDSTGCWGGTETKADGTYTIHGLVGGDDYVVSTWSWQYMNDTKTGISAGDTGVDLTLGTGVSITGWLHNDAAGLGAVWVDAWSDDLGVGGWTLSDSSEANPGYYTITGLQPDTTYIVSAATGNHGFISEEVYVDSSGMYINGDNITGTEVELVDLHIKTGASISGTVTSGDAAITDVEVIVAAFDTLDDTFYNSTTASSSDGTYELTNLPINNTFRVVAMADGYVELWNSGAASYDDAPDLTVVEAGVEDVDFALVGEE